MSAPSTSGYATPRKQNPTPIGRAHLDLAKLAHPYAGLVCLAVAASFRGGLGGVEHRRVPNQVPKSASDPRERHAT